MTTQNPDDVVGPERIQAEVENEVVLQVIDWLEGRENHMTTIRRGTVAAAIRGLMARADLFDKLKQERDDLAVKFGDIGRACKNAMDERDRYRKIINKYGRHTNYCAMMDSLDIRPDCTCGFSEALNPQEHGGGEG